MRSLPAAVAAMLPYALEPTVKVELSADHAKWAEVGVKGGTVTADRTSQVRWSCDLELEPGADVSPYGMWMRVSYGVRVPRHQPVFVPWGLYRVEDVEVGRTSVRVTGSGLEQAVMDARFPTPRTVPGEAGGTVQQVVTRLVREAVPGAAVDWRLDAEQLARDIVVEDDRWALIAGGTDDPSFARALGGEMFFDGRGVFVAAPVPSIRDTPVWTASSGEGGLLVERTRRLSREGVYNLVAVVGVSTDDSPPVGPGYGWDAEQGSPTYAGPDPVDRPELAGPFGVVTRFHENPQVRTMAQATRAARAMLQNSLGLNKQVSFTQLMHPGLEPGDVGLVEEEPGRVVPHVADSWSADIGAGTMSVQTRASKEVAA